MDKVITIHNFYTPFSSFKKYAVARSILLWKRVTVSLYNKNGQTWNQHNYYDQNIINYPGFKFKPPIGMGERLELLSLAVWSPLVLGSDDSAPLCLPLEEFVAFNVSLIVWGTAASGLAAIDSSTTLKRSIPHKAPVGLQYIVKVTPSDNLPSCGHCCCNKGYNESAK